MGLSPNTWAAIAAVGSWAAAVVAAVAAFQSRSSSAKANNTAGTLALIERDRRHSELCPQFKLATGLLGLDPSSGVFRLRIMLAAPVGLGQLDRLTVTIRDDIHSRGEGQLLAGGPSREQIKRQIWGAFRFTPFTGPDEARSDETGRETPYDAVLPIGEALVYQLEANPPPQWSRWTSDEWRNQQGSTLRLALFAERAELGSWRLACEIDVGDAKSTVEVRVPATEP